MSRLMSSLPRVIRPNVRTFAKGEVKRADQKVVQEIQSRQANYQASDEDPVHIKSGRIHFYVTSAVGAVALALNMHGLYNLLSR